MEKDTPTKRNHPMRPLWIGVAVWLTTFAIFYGMVYVHERDVVIDAVNQNFQREAPLWVDSIMVINEEYYYSSGGKRQRPTATLRFTDKYGSYEVAAKFHYHPDYTIRERLHLTSTMLGDRDCLYDVPLVNRVWTSTLQREGIHVETAVELYYRNLREMFPTPDSLNRLAEVFRMESHPFDYEASVRTDTVGIGICDQGQLVGHVVISPSFIMERMQKNVRVGIVVWMIFGIMGLAMFYAEFLLMRQRHVIVPIGTSFLNLKTRGLTYKDGTTRIMGKIPFAILTTLLEAEGRKVPQKTIIDAHWPKIDAEDQRNNLNVNNKRLRDILNDGKHLVLVNDREYIILNEKMNWVESRLRTLRFVCFVMRKQIVIERQ